MNDNAEAPNAQDAAVTAAESSDQPLEERGSNRSRRPMSKAFREFFTQGWADPTPAQIEPAEVAAFTPARRETLSAKFPGDRLVFPAGQYKVRSNDCDYLFRPDSSFAYFTGLGADREPDAVFVMEPTTDGHEPILFFRPSAGRDSEEFYADARYGEMWVGRFPSLAEVTQELQITCRHLDELPGLLGNNPASLTTRILDDVDPSINKLVNDARGGRKADDDAALAEFSSEMRLIKDDYEINQLRDAVAATIRGFENIVRELPQAVAAVRGERVVESAFASTARIHGNGVGYSIIAASGDNACTLHWVRNDGPVRPQDMVLIDAGVELESLYTGDLTRSLPVQGRFSEPQLKIYQAVLDAADAAIAVIRPGAKYSDIHDAAMDVLAHRLEEWGMLPGTAAESLDAENGGFHRRWMIHGTGHHLGLDVHDGAKARREVYMASELKPGMVFTVEPGLYFKSDDLLAPAEFRGIGVRTEDNIVVTEDGYENLSAALPRTAEDIEAWMMSLRKSSHE